MEKKITTAQDIKTATTAFIDYMYNEGVIAYDDKHLACYAKGYQKPDYKDICEGIVGDRLNPLSPASLEMIATLLYDFGEEGVDIVKASIDEAIKDFAEKGNCELLSIIFAQ